MSPPKKPVAKKKAKANNKNPVKKKEFKSQVVVPYVGRVTDAVDRVFKKYGVATAMKPHSTLRNLLVLPKDKVEPLNKGELVYKIPCQNCNKSYIGETGRLLRKRLD